MSVKSSIKSITKSLESIQDDRTYLIKHTRDAVSLCSQSIIAVHGQDLPTAKKKAAEASRLVKKYRPKAVGSLSKYLSMPEQEYTEAMAVIAIAEKKPCTWSTVTVARTSTCCIWYIWKMEFCSTVFTLACACNSIFSHPSHLVLFLDFLRL